MRSRLNSNRSYHVVWKTRKTNDRFKVKNWGGFDLIYLQGKQIHYDRMKVFTIDVTLNLLLPLVVLTHTTMCNVKSMDSSILNLLHTNTHVCDFEIPLKGFRSPSTFDLVAATSTTPNLEFLQGILPVEDFKEFWV